MADRALGGQVALVTGATRGIGEAIAKALAASGATVVGTATTDEGAAKIASYLDNAGARGSGIRLDVSDGAAIDAAITDIEVRFGAISILVNNAGITRDNLLMRMKEDEWDAIMATNLKPAFRLAKAVMRGMMKARHGRIIQIGSVVGSSGNPGQANYAAAKAGLLGLTRAWLSAGARSVVASRWPTPDEDGALFQAFYGDLRKHSREGSAEALRAAQIEMLRSGGWRARPRYWGAYFVVGNE